MVKSSVHVSGVCSLRGKWFAGLFGIIVGVLPLLTQAHSTSAPADEYFGRYHMSVLGIRNTLTDLTKRAEHDVNAAPALLGSARLTEEAMRDWGNQYPNDPWLPKMILSLERLYLDIDTAESEAAARSAVVWLQTEYPQSEVIDAANAAFADARRERIAATDASAADIDPSPTADRAAVTDDGSAVQDDTPQALGALPQVITSTSDADRGSEQNTYTNAVEDEQQMPSVDRDNDYHGPDQEDPF